MIILQTIALLCQFNFAAWGSNIEAKQLECQVFYINCMDEDFNKGISGTDALKKCVLLRSISFIKAGEK